MPTKRLQGSQRKTGQWSFPMSASRQGQSLGSEISDRSAHNKLIERIKTLINTFKFTEDKMSDYYILVDGVAKPCDLITWAKWFETADREVAKDIVGESEVSTVFLGIDHSFGDGPPLLFETLVFGGKLDQEMDRYSTLEEAEVGHKNMVGRLRSEI